MYHINLEKIKKFVILQLQTIKKKEIMQATLSHQPLNPTQIFVLQTFATAQTEKEKEELTSLYLDYIQKKLDKAANEFWDSQSLDNTKMKELMYGHLRSSKK
jgi:hypothetical protein